MPKFSNTNLHFAQSNNTFSNHYPIVDKTFRPQKIRRLQLVTSQPILVHQRTSRLLIVDISDFLVAPRNPEAWKPLGPWKGRMASIVVAIVAAPTPRGSLPIVGWESVGPLCRSVAVGVVKYAIVVCNWLAISEYGFGGGCLWRIESRVLSVFFFFFLFEICVLGWSFLSGFCVRFDKSCNPCIYAKKIVVTWMFVCVLFLVC